MSTLDPMTQEIAAPQPLLWTVRTYLDLITRSDQLVYGEGLKSLYVMSTGLAAYDDDAVKAIAAKAERQGLLPFGLRGFMEQRIVENCAFYARILGEQIQRRIVDIAAGNIPAPRKTVGYNPVATRWCYYLPPQTLVKQIQKVLRSGFYGESACGTTSALSELATTAEFALANAQAREGHMVPQPASYATLDTVVTNLVDILWLEARHSATSDYRRYVRPALTVLWVLSKFLGGDLTMRPQAHELSRVDLGGELAISDGTLAALPFPVKGSFALFGDPDYGRGITLKARAYLNAVSTATLCRTAIHCEG